MERVLLASGSDKGITLLSQLLRESGYNQITNTKSGNDARRCINQTEYELIVINTPLTDEFGHEFSIKAAECSNSGIILICKSDISEDELCLPAPQHTASRGGLNCRPLRAGVCRGRIRLLVPAEAPYARTV